MSEPGIGFKKQYVQLCVGTPVQLLALVSPACPLPCFKANNLAHLRLFFTVSAGGLVNSTRSCLPDVNNCFQ